MDIWNKEKRSQIMSRVKHKNTKPEVLVCKFLFSQGFRYRKNVKTLSGSPDIVLPKYKTAIFIHGCFWHGHDCRAGRRPTSNTDYWFAKIESNIKRDSIKEKALEVSGWKVMTVWQCELKTLEKRALRFNQLIKEIRDEK